MTTPAGADLDRLYDFLIKNKASYKTAENALLKIKNGASFLIRNPATWRLFFAIQVVH